MSSHLPALRPREVVRALERGGWQVQRQRGSHLSMKKEGTRLLVTIPMHRRDIPKGTLRGIIEDAGLTLEEFVGLLPSRPRRPR